MKTKGIKYTFTAKPWQHSTPGGWHFISLPHELAKEIRENLKWQEEGWGRLKAKAKIEKTEWETAIWFDTKHNTYLLPIKAKVREEINLEIGKNTESVIWV
jgi:Domain of unknown function (DUF1905)